MSESRLTFWGAAGQVTGSCHLLEMHGHQVLLDAGLFQGRREASRRLNAELPFDPRQIDSVILSHAHIDHAGRLPLLTAHQYDKAIHATPATRDLSAVMLADAAQIQESDHAWMVKHGRHHVGDGPLYTVADAVRVQELMHGHPYGRPFRVNHTGMIATFHDAGHILGSASVELTGPRDGDPRIVFSGDIGRWDQPIIRDPAPPQGPVDVLIIESTYALRTHGLIQNAREALGALVRRVAGRGGKVLIPAFALGRTQEIVYALHELLREGAIPEVPIFIDSPLALEATDVFRMHPEVFDRSESLVNGTARILDHRLVHYVRSVEESKRLNGLKGAAVIIAASGMVEAGRILHHLINHGGHPDNAIVFVAFQAEHTLGRRLKDGRRPIRIFGEEREIRAEIASIEGYSAHADQDGLRRWVRGLGGPVRRAFCVHGEPEALEGMRKLLLEEGVERVEVPGHGEAFEI